MRGEEAIAAGSETLRVATLPSLLYVPQFAAAGLGFYADEGVEVEFVEPQVGYGSINSLLSGSADALLGNIWLALRFADRSNPLVPFAQVTQQCRYVVTCRRGQAPSAFRWTALRGAVVVVPSSSPTPWVAFRETLHRCGLTLDEVRPIVGYSPTDAREDFLAGLGDYLLIDGELAEHDGLEELGTVAEVLGPVPWSVYYYFKAEHERVGGMCARFGRALSRAERWVDEHDGAAVSEVLAEWFGDVPPDERRGVVERYKRLQLWPRDAALDRDQTEEWQRALVTWGLLPRAVSVNAMLGLASQQPASASPGDRSTDGSAARDR